MARTNKQWDSGCSSVPKRFPCIYIPQEIVIPPFELTGSAILLFGKLREVNQRMNGIRLSNRYLASDLGIDKRSIQLLLNELKLAGLISISEERGGRQIDILRFAENSSKGYKLKIPKGMLKNRSVPPWAKILWALIHNLIKIEEFNFKKDKTSYLTSILKGQSLYENDLRNTRLWIKSLEANGYLLVERLGRVTKFSTKINPELTFNERTTDYIQPPAWLRVN